MHVVVYMATFLIRFVQFRVPLVCRGAHFVGYVAGSMAVQLLLAGTSLLYVSVQNVTARGGPSNTTSAGAPVSAATISAEDKGAVMLLSTLCFVAVVVELLSWVSVRGLETCDDDVALADRPNVLALDTGLVLVFDSPVKARMVHQ